MSLETTPITHIPGVGPAKQKSLASLNICSVYDLIHFFPLRYEDWTVQPFANVKSGEVITVRAALVSDARLQWKGKRSYLTASLQVDGQVNVKGIWFNQPYLKNKLLQGALLTIRGRFDAGRKLFSVSHTQFGGTSFVSEQATFVPVYRTVEGFSGRQLQQTIKKALESFEQDVDEVLPQHYREKYRLVSRVQALHSMHSPASAEDLRQAHRRLAFEEFFLFQLQLQWFRRQRDERAEGHGKSVPDAVLEDFIQSLPAPMTSAQAKCCKEIQGDLSADRCMNRLLQGDVGSGKTWVALATIYMTYRALFQSAFMAPTEILAAQHFQEVNRRLEPLGLKTALLTGGTTASDRTEILRGLACGEIDVIVGTHALLSEGVDFSRLGLVITDEQHRFGVSQRSILRNKGQTPDVLFLSATPIPRTLAMAIYGDLDVSVLNELPKGRQSIITSALPVKDAEKAMRLVRRELSHGRQAYVVAPLIEESEDLDMTSAATLFGELTEVFAGFRVGLLHGRLSQREKDSVMERFSAGEIHVLVSTTVIEVGIDVPNATVMAIYHAERFGLAQLHQLRGRVGRGAHQSYCILLGNPGNEIARERIRTMTETTDGFVIAEKDLELRGPGELLGHRQSGLPEFSVGHLDRDFKVMEVARDEAKELLRDPGFWLEPKYITLRSAVERAPRRTYYQD